MTKYKLPELAWDWSVIASVMIWKVARNGFVMPMEALTTLPRDRVLFEDRRPDRIILSFVSVEWAQRRARPERGENRATVSELQGRWQKIGVCAAWHFARIGWLGKNDSITLTPQDRAELDASTLQLMVSSDRQGPEFRFMNVREATKVSDWFEEQEGLNIKEKLQ